MKKLIAAGVALLLMAVPAAADYTFIVPQKPGGGTDVWARIVASEMEKYLDGERIIIENIPGARDIAGFNQFANEKDGSDKVVMVSHGGNAVSFLQENVDYDYRDYESIGLMNLDIIAGKLKGDDMEHIKFASGSGMTPEAMAFTMLRCGPRNSIDEYVACFKDNVTWVNGMSGAERRLAFQRGELNGTRENPAAYKKHVEGNPNAELWFTHGILQADGSRADDPNYPDHLFDNLYKEKWGVEPSGTMYDSYNLVRSFRDALQKALWVHKGNPNTEKLRAALEKVATNPGSVAAIEKEVGQYDWVIGSDAEGLRDTLMTFITEPALEALVKFNKEALGLDSIYKPYLVN